MAQATTELRCAQCGKPLAGGLDTFGEAGRELCNSCFLAYETGLGIFLKEYGAHQVTTVAPCVCAKAFMQHGGWWECPQHGVVHEESYVKRAGLTLQCPYCTSHRLRHTDVLGIFKCMECYETYEWEG